MRRLTLVVAVLLLGGCAARLPTRGEVARTNSAFPELAGAEVRGEPLAAYARRRTVLLIDGPNWHFVRRGDGTATLATPGDSASAGVVVTGDGYVVTSAHGVSAGRTLAALPPFGPGADRPPRLRPARVVWDGTSQDPPADVAVLKLGLLPGDRPLPHVPLPALAGPPRPRGTALLMAGVAPDDSGGGDPPALAFASGRVVGQSDLGDAGHLVAVAAPVRPGFSGGPALDARGRVGGITTQLAARVRPRLAWPLPTWVVRFTTILVRPDAGLIGSVIERDRQESATGTTATAPQSR